MNRTSEGSSRNTNSSTSRAHTPSWPLHRRLLACSALRAAAQRACVSAGGSKTAGPQSHESTSTTIESEELDFMHQQSAMDRLMNT